MMNERDNVDEAKEARLIEWLKAGIEEAKKKGEPMFLGAPDAWFDSGLHCCNNGHINRMYVKSEFYGRCVCMTCEQPSHICPPGMTEELLKIILNL